MDKSVNAPVQSENAITTAVWYTGTDAIKKGEAFCYDVTNGTLTAANGCRHNYVTRPTSANAGAFAGVAASDVYASTTGSLVMLNVPGSKGVSVALGVDTVANVGMLTFQVGGGNGAAGRFVKAGFAGRGSIIPRQTVTAVLESSMTGAWSLATDGKTLTVVATAGLSAGDTVILLGGEDDGTGAIVPGKYTIASITSATVLVLTASAATATPAGALTCTGYAFTGNPTCQADLLDGDESYGVDFVAPPNTGAADSLAFMPSGVTYILGGITIGTADANGALADGAAYGQKKGFVCLGALTTNDVSVTLATAGVQNAVTDAIDVAGNGTPLALAKAEFDDAGELLFLVWYGLWKEIVHSGATLAAS